MRDRRKRAIWPLGLSAAMLVACTGAGSPASPARSVGEQMSTGPEGSSACTPAPEWLNLAVSDGILVRGAYLSNTYVADASGFTSGPEVIFTDAFADAWWVAGKLTGAGVQPELAVWLTNRTDEASSGEIFAVSSAARRYWRGEGGVREFIAGLGMDAAVACVGPLPRT